MSKIMDLAYRFNYRMSGLSEAQAGLLVVAFATLELVSLVVVYKSVDLDHPSWVLLIARLIIWALLAATLTCLYYLRKAMPRQTSRP